MPAKAKQYAPESESEEELMDDMGGDPTKYLNKNFSREFMATLPAKIRDRTKLLISFDDEYLKEQAAYEAKVKEIKMKYEELYKPLYSRRKDIITGASEPTEEEITKGFPEEHKGQVEITPSAEDGKEDTVKGIPQFWIDALRHHVILDEMITERDAEVLEHLIDITTATLENGFSVTFVFAPNEFMKETEVTKTIFTKKEFGQLAIDRTEETSITWEDRKNVTVEYVEKKQKSKKTNSTRVVQKEEPCESFFNLFKQSEGEEADQWCAVAATISDKVIPFAVEYLTGEAPDGSSDLDDGEDYYGEEDEEEEEEEEPAPRGKGNKGGPSGKAPAGAAGKDCKQQ